MVCYRQKAIGKNSSQWQKFPNKINLGSKFITSTHSKPKTLTNILLKLVQILQISTPLANFDTYLNNKCNIFQPENASSIKELTDTFYSLKINKNPGYDDISSNIIKQCFDTLNRPLHYLCNISLQSGVFPEEMKIARVTPIFKGGEVFDLRNYRSISVLCNFSKILEKLMYNCLYNIYLIAIYFIRNDWTSRKSLNWSCNYLTSWSD